MTEMEYREKVKKIVSDAKGEITYAEIARKTGQSPQNLSNKMATGRIRAWEMFQILDAITDIEKEGRS